MVLTPNDADNPRQRGRREGHRRKDSAHAVLEARREKILTQGRRELLTVSLNRITAEQRGWATANDVRDRLTLPPDIKPVCLGAIPKPLAMAGIIRRNGFISTARPEAHARPVSVWELVDPEAARQWLIDHPAPLPLTTPVDAVETTENAPVAAAPENGATHQRVLFGGGN